MRNIVIIVAVFVLFGGVFFILQNDTHLDVQNGIGDDAESLTEAEQVVLSDDGEEIVIVSTDGDQLYNYRIETLNEWTSEYWDSVFAERPAFGEVREVNHESFARFDQVVALSPDRQYVAFVVSDYAVATTLSFVGILNYQTDTVELIRAVNNGGVGELVWSEDSQYIAYRLDTARASGDSLVTASVAEREQLFMLDAEMLLSELGDTETEWRDYLPEFTNLRWLESNQVSFDYTHPDGGTVSGLVNPAGTSLELE